MLKSNVQSVKLKSYFISVSPEEFPFPPFAMPNIGPALGVPAFWRTTLTLSILTMASFNSLFETLDCAERPNITPFSRIVPFFTVKVKVCFVAL